MIPNFGLIMLCAIIAIGTGVVVAIFDEKKKMLQKNNRKIYEQQKSEKKLDATASKTIFRCQKSLV